MPVSIVSKSTVAAAVAVAVAVLASSTQVAAHSWLECTDYRVTPGSDATKVWDKSLCFGHARCGQRQASEGFGVDTGFNFHSGSGCQCARNDGNYDGVTKAVYTPGQRVCLAYPSKNHVAAACTNAYVPDAGVKILRSAVGVASDDDVSRTYAHANGDHVGGQVDYRGFQNCPNFCSNMDKSLCTMCFDLEADLAPGEYTFRWIWAFNSDEDAYSSCWEAEVKASGAYSGGGVSGSEKKVVGTVHAAEVTQSFPVVTAVAPTPTLEEENPQQEYDAEELDCDDDGRGYELDCDEGPSSEQTLDPTAVGLAEEEECDQPLPMATEEAAVVALALAPSTSTPTPTPTPTPTVGNPTTNPYGAAQDVDCKVAPDGPGVVHPPE